MTGALLGLTLGVGLLLIRRSGSGPPQPRSAGPSRRDAQRPSGDPLQPAPSAGCGGGGPARGSGHTVSVRPRHIWDAGACDWCCVALIERGVSLQVKRQVLVTALVRQACGYVLGLHPAALPPP